MPSLRRLVVELVPTAWTRAPLTPSAGDLRAFREACRDTMETNWTAIGIGAALAALLWWPTDAWLYPDQPEVRAAFGLFRVGIACTNVVLLGLRAAFREALRRFIEPVAGVVVCAQVGFVAWCLGLVPDQLDQLFPFLYPAPLFMVALMVPPGPRALWTSAASASVWVAAHRQLLPTTPEAQVHLSFLLFTTTLALALGHVVYRLSLGQFLALRRLAEHQAALQSLTSSLEERVAEQATHLLDLNRQAASARQRERERIARDLHDGLGQELTGARLVAQALSMGAHPAEVQEAIGDLCTVLGRSHQSLRQAVHELAPSALEEHGLLIAVRGMVEETARRAGLSAELDLAPIDVAVPAPVAVAAFRVAQEALSNVAQHAAASAVRVRLAVDAERLTLEVADDGRGLGAAPEAGRSHFGLLGIQARVRALGGEVSWESDAGTTVRVQLPLEAA